MSLKDKAWEEVQIKAFTHWVNSYLSQREMKVESLTTDFCDGTRLIALLEILTGIKQTKKYQKNPKTRVHFIENCHLALMLLKESKRLKNAQQFGAEDFADGNMKLILGFLWTLLRTFRQFGSSDNESDEGKYEDILLHWLKETLAEYELPIHDFTHSFADGRIFLALLNKYDESFVNFETVDASKKLENVTQAFHTAEEKISIPQLIDPAVVASGEADERSMVLYVSLIQNAFAAKARLGELESTKTGFSSKMAELKSQLEAAETEKAEFVSKTNSLQQQLTELQAKLDEQIKLNEELRKKNSELEQENQDLKKSGDSLNSKTTYLTEKIDVMKQLLQQETDEKTELLSAKEKLEHQIKKLEKEKAELEAEKDHLHKEREALEHEQKDMMDSMERFNQAKKNLEAQYEQRSGLNMKGLDILRKNLMEHLQDMNTWKKYLEQDREYKSESIQNVTEKQIASASFEEQCEQLATSLASENTKLQQLLKEREMEVAEQEAAGANKAPAKKKEK